MRRLGTRRGRDIGNFEKKPADIEGLEGAYRASRHPTDACQAARQQTIHPIEMRQSQRLCHGGLIEGPGAKQIGIGP